MRTKTKISILSALMVLSMFAMAVMPASASPGTTTATEETATDNPDPSTSGAVITEGGNITNVDLEVDSYTERWAGFYGDVTGTINLTDGTYSLYNWTWTPASEGEVIASTADSGIAWADLQNGVAVDVDNSSMGWDFSSGSDTAVLTFTDSDTFIIGNTTMTTAPAAATCGTTGYKTGIVVDVVNTSIVDTDNFLFVVNIQNDGTTFNNGTHDFEMIVPTNDTVGETETYYFYVELS